MTTEELLKPRYKVIADYPHSPYKIGDLLEEYTKTAFKVTVTYPHSDIELSQVNTYPTKSIDTYPHLFKKLDWWEDRKLEDMPEYVKWNSCNSGRKYVVKILGIKDDHFMWKEGWETFTEGQDFPATREEYEQYLKTKQ